MSDLILVCSDRDGTINADENYYLGSSLNWKEQIAFLPGVVEGIRLINQIPFAKFVITTNQAGVALSGERFENLTEDVGHEVNREIVGRLENHGAKVAAYFMCPYVDRAYAEKAVKKGRTIDPSYVRDNHPHLKPNPGMIEAAATALGKKLSEIKHKFVLGDRLSDVKLALNSDSFGILIPSFQTAQDGDLEKMQKLKSEHPEQIEIVSDFLSAARLIQSKVGRSYLS